MAQHHLARGGRRLGVMVMKGSQHDSGLLMTTEA